jgi:ferredoxin
MPHSREEYIFGPSDNNVESQSDLLIDLTGDTPLFTGWQKRDGYFRANANDLIRITEIEAQAREMIGDFEKPIHINFDENLCAHSRNRLEGCNRCLDACPAGAVISMGDHVSIDPGICGGCGQCAAVCPSGAAQSGFPAVDDIINRISLLAKTYLSVGGKKPVLMIHDANHGRDVISSLARYSRGLPANVIPLELYAVGRVSHDIILGAMASGFERVLVIVNPQHADEATPLRSQAELSAAMLSGIGINPENRIIIIDDADPDAIEAKIWSPPTAGTVKSRNFLALGAPRAIARLAMDSLARAHKPKSDIIPLPAGAPYGRVNINTDDCTICLSCVGACPSGALQDNPDAPQLLFREDACLQCGICVATCPEKVISLEPQFNLNDNAKATTLIIEDSPFHCESCGKAFGTTRSIESVIERLSSHSMFPDSKRLNMLKMCEDCRVGALFDEVDSDSDIPPRRKPRTTDDYLN